MKRVLKAVMLGSLLSLLALAATGCGGNAAAGTRGAKESLVNVQLVSFSVTADTATVPAGKVTFKAKNIDTISHEMLVIPMIKGGLENMPYDKTISRIPEDQIESLGEVPEIEGGTSGEVTLDLAPGTYMLFCNLTAHYESGMHTILTVK